MNSRGVDLWADPSATGPAPKGIESTGNRIMSSAWNYVGFPAMNLPVARAKNGLPVGFQLIGPTMSDESLMSWSELIYFLLTPQ